LGPLEFEPERLSISLDLLEAFFKLCSQLLDLALIRCLELVDAGFLGLICVVKLSLVVLFDALQLLVLSGLERDEALLDLADALAVLLMLIEKLSALLL